MASEEKRGCGYRKVGGMYLVGDYRSVPCDRLPYPLEICPVCGAGIKAGRGMTKINPLHLFGEHTIKRAAEVITGGYEKPREWQDITERCGCHYPCFMCDPTDDIAFLMRVGEKYYPTPEDFTQEGIRQGFCKRIAQIPHDFEIGQTVIYLAHINACAIREPVAVQQAMTILEGNKSEQARLVEAEKEKRVMGIFTAFIPHRIEKLFWQSELDAMTYKDREQLTKRGITPIGIPDGDKDHK